MLPVLPGEDVVAGEMETDTGQATEMPALDCSEGGGDEDTGAEVLEIVTEAQDLPGSTPNTAGTGIETVRDRRKPKYAINRTILDKNFHKQLILRYIGIERP